MPQPVLAAVIIAASISLFDVAELRRLSPGPHVRVRAGRGVRARRRLRRRPPGHRHRGRALGDVHLQAGLDAVLDGPRQGARACPATTTSGATRTRRRSRACSSSAGPRRSSSPTRTSSATGSGRSSSWSDPPPKWVLVAAEPITDIDTTAGAMLADLDLELNAQRHPPRLRRAPVGRARHDRAVRAPGDHRGGPFLRVGDARRSRRYRREVGQER